MAQAASFLMSKSAVDSRWITGGSRPLLITSWICSRLPAVMLEMVQQLSFRMAFFAWDNSFSRQGKTPLCKITWQWVKNRYPKWYPGKWTHGLKTAVLWGSLLTHTLLRLVVIPCDDIPHRPQGRSLHQRRGVTQELHQALGNPCLDHRSDALVGSI